jgi:hypothetical protein
MNRGATSANNGIAPIDFPERDMLMPRKPALLLHLLNLVLRPIAGQTKVTSKQHVALPEHPPAHDREAWRARWKARSQPWRTEPEIDVKRQEYLSVRRAISPNLEQGIYPFKDIKLGRADVEWLLATHENGRGPVDWSDESQRGRMGLDVRGADLRQVDLSNLPLARLCGGTPRDEWYVFVEQRSMYAVTQYATTEEQRMTIAMLMVHADLIGAHLEEVNFTGAHLEGAHLSDVHLEEAYLVGTHLEGADLAFAHLKDADFTWAHLERVDLSAAHLEEACLDYAVLTISGDKQGIGPQVVDTHWGATNLAVADWSQMKKLGEEHEAKQKKTSRGKVKDTATRLGEYQAAVRANRQLANAFLNQGLNEDAIRFTYRAQVLQKSVWRLQMTQHGMKLRQRAQALGAWLFSWFLFLISGYGYRLWRSFLAYTLVIIGFTTVYYVLGASGLPPLSLVNALVQLQESSCAMRKKAYLLKTSVTSLGRHPWCVKARQEMRLLARRLVRMLNTLVQTPPSQSINTNALSELIMKNTL